MTTFTSNNNNTFGKTFSNKNVRENLDYSERSGCGGYALLAVLIAVAVVIFVVIAQYI